MGELKIDPPNPKQELFFEADTRHVAYGGARGGGKSWALRIKFILLALHYAGINLLLLRRTFPQLQANHIVPLQKMLHGIARYNSSDKVFLFPNGSRLKLGYCDKEKDVTQYQGHEYEFIGFEECTHFTWSQVQFISTSNRSPRADVPKRIYYTGNPGGPGHAWFKRIFIDKKFTDAEKPSDYSFIAATVDDNTVLMENDPDYVALLDALPEKLKQAHRYGNWHIFEGQFFEEFRDMADNYKDRKHTHVIAPFEIPKEWRIYRSFDFGYSKPFSCAWWALDHEGRLYRILELYGCTKEPNEGVKWEPNRIFKEIRDIELQHRWLKDKKIIGIADPSIWDSSRGESIAETAEKHRVYFEPGDNARLPGWMQVHYRMAFDDEGIPMMYIFENCKAFIRTMPLLQYSDTKPEDLDTSQEDHVADEVRYMCMANPIPPRKVTARKEIAYNPLDTDDKEMHSSYNYLHI